MATRKKAADTAAAPKKAPRKRAPKKAAPEAEVIETQVQAEQVKEPVKATAKTAAPQTVTVCLNFPYDIKYNVPDASGKMTTVKFNGNAGHLKGKAKGVIPIGAFGLTPNVPKEVWDYIVRTRPDEPLIKSGNLFIAEAGQAAAAAAERKNLRHGFEPVKPEDKE